MVDADSLLDPQALLQRRPPVRRQPRPGGRRRRRRPRRQRLAVDPGRVTACGCRGRWLSRIAGGGVPPRVPDRPRGLVGPGGLLIISGAFGIFRKDVLPRSRAWPPTASARTPSSSSGSTSWLGREQRGEVVFVPEPVAWTEAPETARSCASSAAAGTAASPRSSSGTATCCSVAVRRDRHGHDAVVLAVRAAGAGRGGLRPAYFLVVMVLLVGETGWFPWDLVNPGFVLLLLAASILFAVFVTRGPARRGAVLPPLPWAAGPAPGDLGRGRGELRLPPAQRVLAAGGCRRGAAQDPARLGRHEPQGFRNQLRQSGRSRVARVIACPPCSCSWRRRRRAGSSPPPARSTGSSTGRARPAGQRGRDAGPDRRRDRPARLGDQRRRRGPGPVLHGVGRAARHQPPRDFRDAYPASARDRGPDAAIDAWWSTTPTRGWTRVPAR